MLRGGPCDPAGSSFFLPNKHQRPPDILNIRHHRLDATLLHVDVRTLSHARAAAFRNLITSSSSSPCRRIKVDPYHVIRRVSP